MIKNVIFDVGRVLVDWDPEPMFRELGFDGETAKIVARATVYSDDWAEYDRSAVSDEEMLEKFISNAPAYEKEIRLVWENAGRPVHRRPYAAEWIRSLRREGYHVYILSNYSRHTYEQTGEELSFVREADGALFSFEVGLIKPEPEIYQSLFSRFQLDPKECIFLDDCEENITAGEALGMSGIVFTSYEQAIAELAGYGVGCHGENA